MPDPLEPLMRAADRLTVELIAQEPDCVQVGLETATQAFARAEANKFDFMPVRVHGRITHVISRQNLGRIKARGDGALLEAAEPVSVSHLVSVDSPIFSLLPRLGERPFLLCLGRNGITHVVTPWDLAQPAACQFAFGLAVVVEGEVAQAIDDALPDERARRETLRKVSENGALAKEARAWEERWERGEQIAFGRSLSFGGKLELLRHSPAVAAILRRRSASRWAQGDDNKVRTELGEIQTLRNHIAHDSAASLDPSVLRRLMHLAHDVAQVLVAGRHEEQDDLGLSL